MKTRRYLSKAQESDITMLGYHCPTCTMYFKLTHRCNTIKLTLNSTVLKFKTKNLCQFTSTIFHFLTTKAYKVVLNKKEYDRISLKCYKGNINVEYKMYRHYLIIHVPLFCVFQNKNISYYKVV